jgi:hypothetical protein
LFVSVAAAQSNPQPQTASAVAIVEPNYGYTQPTNSLRQIDFGNFDFVIFDVNAQLTRRVSLENGQYHESQDQSGSDLTLGPVQYFGVSRLSIKREPNYALLTLRERDWGGSPADAAIVQVFKMEKHHLYIVQQFTFDQQAPGAGVSFDSKTGRLIIRARTSDNTPACCPRSLDVVSFRWNGRQFTQESAQTLRLPTQNK